MEDSQIRTKYKIPTPKRTERIFVVLCDLEGSFKKIYGNEEEVIRDFIDKICEMAQKCNCNEINFSFISSNSKEEILSYFEKIKKIINIEQIFDKYQLNFKLETQGADANCKVNMACNPIEKSDKKENITHAIYFDDNEEIGAMMIAVNLKEICTNLQEFIFVTKSAKLMEDSEEMQVRCISIQNKDMPPLLQNSIGEDGYITSGLKKILQELRQKVFVLDK